MADQNNVLTVAEAAEVLHLNPVTLYRALKRGALPGAFRVGGVWRFHRKALERLMMEGARTEATSVKKKGG
jgi:excisionase family DNA binding protein